MERVEKVRSTSCGDIVGVILSLTRRREVREVSIFLHSRAIEWDVSSRGIYRYTKRVGVLDGVNIGGNNKRRRFWKSLYYTTDIQDVY